MFPEEIVDAIMNTTLVVLMVIIAAELLGLLLGAVFGG